MVYYSVLLLGVILERFCTTAKNRNFTQFPGMEILRKGTALTEFSAMAQSFHSGKLGEITVFYAVYAI